MGGKKQTNRTKVRRQGDKAKIGCTSIACLVRDLADVDDVCGCCWVGLPTPGKLSGRGGRSVCLPKDVVPKLCTQVRWIAPSTSGWTSKH